MSPFSALFSWGTRKRRLLLPKRAAALCEGTQWCKGGTQKAEAARLQDAGISLKQCPRKRVAYPIRKIGAVSAELCEKAKRNRKNQPCNDRHSSHNSARFKWLLRFAAVTSG